MLIRMAGFAALVLLGLSLGACGTKGSLGFKERSTTTTTARTTRSTRGDDSLEEDPPPPPADLDDPVDAGAGLHQPGCPSRETETATSTTAPTRAPAFALVATPGPGVGSAGC